MKKLSDNKLIKVTHPEKGVWYFTNRWQAAEWSGTHPAAVSAVLAGGKRKDGIDFELVDGSEIKWKDIN